MRVIKSLCKKRGSHYSPALVLPDCTLSVVHLLRYSGKTRPMLPGSGKICVTCIPDSLPEIYMKLMNNMKKSCYYKYCYFPFTSRLRQLSDSYANNFFTKVTYRNIQGMLFKICTPKGEVFQL